MKRRLVFAPPFVVTVALGCGTSPAPAPSPHVPHPDETGDELTPKPAAAQLIVDVNEGDAVDCYVVRPWSGNVADQKKGQVPCPEGGPTVVVPDPSYVRVDGDVITIEARLLTCYHQVGTNPPHLEPIAACPDELLPSLANGAAVTDRKDGACWWNHVRVRCP